MERILEIIKLYGWYMGLGLVGITLFIVPLVISIKYRIRLLLSLKGVMEDPDLASTLIFPYYNSRRLYSHSRLISRIDWKNGSTLHRILHLDDIWIERLSRRNSRRSFKFLLKFAVSDALFLCFKKSLSGGLWFRKVFQRWLAETGLVKGLNEVGLASDGSDFPGKKGLELFEDNISDIRSFAARPEKPLRYTAVKLLIHDNADVSRRILWECFRDPYYVIRQTLATEFKSEDKQRLYNELFKLYINDPVRIVRIAARERINRDFSDLYSINIENLNDFERLHALEHLDVHSKADENLALNFLISDKLEERFTAAVFLEKCGTLNRMIQQADLGDRKDLERKRELLVSASDVRVTHFFDEAVRSKNRGTLLLAIDILSRTGRRDFIVQISQTIFSLPLSDPDSFELYYAALNCINLRGNEDAFRLMDEQLKKNRSNRDLCCRILEAVPIRGVFVFKDTLLEFLTDENFDCFDILREIVLQSPPYLFIEELFGILHFPDQYCLKIRKESLKILARMNTPDLTQNLLENLFLLERVEAEELAALMSTVSAERFQQILKRLMESHDSSIRISLLYILPGLENSKYGNFIVDSLEDTDPEVRIAAVRALVRSPGQSDFSCAFPLLRDPLGIVREETALVLGETAGKTVLKELKSIILSNDEVDSVRRAAVLGLGRCRDSRSLEILAPLLETHYELETVLKETLSHRDAKKDVEVLISIFKEASPLLREQLVDVFIMMGHRAEEPLLALLGSSGRDLVSYVNEVLESTGYIETQAQKLNHRSPEVRLHAVERLNMIATRSSYKALLSSARDVNKNVRLEVFKGLSRLKSKEGMSLLEELKDDPDKDIRRHAAWAKNRLEAL